MNYFYGGVSEAAKAGLAAYRNRLAQIKTENPNITHKQAVAMARVSPAKAPRKPRASRKKNSSSSCSRGSCHGRSSQSS